MVKGDTRLALIQTGRRIIVEKGYNHTGIQEVLQAVGVPKGSFYHFFKSKEDFGLQIIQHEAAEHDRILDCYLNDETRSPLNRLKHYFEDKRKEFEALHYREGCLLGNLGQEMADQNETFRQHLQIAYQDWRQRVADCLRQAQVAHEVSTVHDACDLAEYCVNSWEGALLCMKTTKSIKPLEVFMHLTFEVVLKP